MNFVAKLLGGALEPAAKYFTRRMELRSERDKHRRELEAAMHERRVQLIREGLAADANWEMEFAKQAATSWKDEYTLLVVSIPAVLAFVDTPWLDGPGIVIRGFAALGTTPLWYQGLLLTLFFATVGVRYWRRSQSDT